MGFRRDSLPKNKLKKFDASIGRDYSEDAKVHPRLKMERSTVADAEDSQSEQTHRGEG